MGIQKHGLVVSCENCRHVASDACSFDIAVPVRLDEAAGTARLHCTITPECHRIEFVGWDEAPSPADAADRLRLQVSAVLGFIADQRLCGNERLCPMRVVQLVEEHTAAATRGTRSRRSA